MLKILMNNPDIRSEAQGTNVRWALPTLACLAAVLWLAAACGDEAIPVADDYVPPTQTADELITLIKECRTREELPEITQEYAVQIRDKYLNLIERQPNIWSHGVGHLEDSDGNFLQGTTGISIYVTKRVNPNALPPEDRIPDCLEGVAVQILEVPRGDLS